MIPIQTIYDTDGRLHHKEYGIKLTLIDLPCEGGCGTILMRPKGNQTARCFLCKQKMRNEYYAKNKVALNKKRRDKSQVDAKQYASNLANFLLRK